MEELQHGCRAEYGALELRIQTTARLNGFVVYVEDPRLDHVMVYEHAELNTLESAKGHAVLRATEYLSSLHEPPPDAPDWRCS
jgi:hypothetical protein